MKTGLAIFTALALAAFPAMASAQDFAKGLAAFELGDYAAALKEWQPLADQGLDMAQFNLGFMYGTGYGGLRDYGAAARWYRLAADQAHRTMLL